MHHNKIQVTRSRDEFADTRIAELPVPAVYYPEEEISLLDIWLVLVKRRHIVIGVFTACVLFSLFPIFMLQPVFESRAVLEIGQVAGVGLLEPRENLIQRLREDYRVDDTSEGPRQWPFVSSIGNDKKSAANTLTITVNAHDSAGAQSYLWQITNKIIEQHKFTYQKALQEQKKQLDYIDTQFQAYQNQVDQLSQSIKSIEKKDAAQAALLMLEKAKLVAVQPDLVDKRIALSRGMAEPQSSATHLLRNPTMPIGPIKPKKSLYLILAVVVGSVLAVFAAFFVEFITKAREQLRIRSREELSSV